MKKLWSDFIYNLRGMRTQMFLILLCVGTIPIIFLVNLITNEYNSQLISQRTDELQSYGTVISNLVTSSGYLSSQESSDVENETEEIANIYQGRIIIVDKDLKVIRDTYNIENGKSMVSTEVVKCFSDDQNKYINNLGEYMQLTMPIVDPVTNETTGAIIISYSTKNIQLTSKAVTRKVIFAVCAIVLVILLISFVYSIFLTKPLSKLTDSINEISKGNMAVKLDMHGYSELHKITDSFNQMIEVIQNQESSRQEFVSNVSHELKTPIALIQGYSEGLKDNILDDEESKEFYCDVIADEAKKMNRMVQKLLTLNQIEFGNNQVNMERFDITEMIQNMVEASKILVEKQGVQIIFDEPETHVWADEFMIEEVVNNYLSNARNHVTDGGIIKVSYCQHGKDLRVKVFNTGDHIPQEDIDKLWVKFYKVDKARTREYGGSGIGLSIVEATMKAHGKDYGVTNVEGGVEFYFEVESADSESE